MRVLYLGDVVGRSGREAVARHLPGLRERLAVDFTIINGENAAGGFGLTGKICDEFHELGIGCVVTGNHVWDNRDILERFGDDKRLLRPLNFPRTAPGGGAGVYTLDDGRRVGVLQVMGRIFMDPLDDPFVAVEEALARMRLRHEAEMILLDVHGEATSEKMALGHWFDGRVTAVVGTHTHVPTADHVVLDGGTAYISDVGMCGDYDSVIGMEKTEPLRRFTRKVPEGRFAPASGEATLCGVLIDSDDATGKARSIAPIRLGGRLSQIEPASA